MTEVVYRTPEDTEESSGPENPGNSQDDTSPPADTGVGDGAHASGASEVIARERFPIPMEVRKASRSSTYVPGITRVGAIIKCCRSLPYTRYVCMTPVVGEIGYRRSSPYHACPLDQV